MEIFNIEHTIPSDSDLIHWMFEEAIEYQKRKGYPIWISYDKNQLRDEMKNKKQYKITINGNLACIFSVFYSDPVIWREKEIGNAIYLHRIVTNPKYKGRKLFGKILDWAKSDVKEKGLELIRMDTWADNPNIISYYQSFGFNFIGNFTTPDTKELAAHYRNQPLALLELEL